VEIGVTTFRHFRVCKRCHFSESCQLWFTIRHLPLRKMTAIASQENWQLWNAWN